MSMPDEFYHEMEMREVMADVRACRQLLDRLPVAQLRILAAYYLGKGADWAKREVKAWPKLDCVAYLAEEHTDAIVDRIWRGR